MTTSTGAPLKTLDRFLSLKLALYHYKLVYKLDWSLECSTTPLVLSGPDGRPCLSREILALVRAGRSYHTKCTKCSTTSVDLSGPDGRSDPVCQGRPLKHTVKATRTQVREFLFFWELRRQISRWFPLTGVPFHRVVL